MKTIDETTVPERMTRIERLMIELDSLSRISTIPGARISDVEGVARDARQLILDLLGMSDLPVGERLYKRAIERIYAEHAAEDKLTGSAEELRASYQFSRRWKADVWPASDDGQVPFARAIYEHMEDAVRRHLDAEHRA